MHKRMRWRRVTVLSAHSYAPTCFRRFLLSSNGPFDLVATFLCPPRKRPKGAREDQVTHVKSNLRIGFSCSLGYVVDFQMSWTLFGHKLATEQFKSYDCGHKASYQENFENHMWSKHGAVHCGDLIGKTREGSCCALSPNSPTETAPKYAAQHAAITPMHGLSHIPWSNIFHAIKMRNLWPRLTRYHEL